MCVYISIYINMINNYSYKQFHVNSFIFILIYTKYMFSFHAKTLIMGNANKHELTIGIQKTWISGVEANKP